MEFKYAKKEIRWFWNTDLNGRKTQEKAESEEKILELNSEEKKWKKMASSSSENKTSAESMFTERQNVGET